MKSMLSLTAAAVLCASTSFAQEAPAQTDTIQGQAGVATVDGQEGLFAGGLAGAGVAGGLGLLLIAVVASNDDNTNSTTGTN